MHEADEPDALVDLFDADVLAGEDRAEVDLAPVEADAPAVGHGNGVVVQRVGELAEASIRPRGRGIEFGGIAHLERLMRPLVIEAVDELIEAFLLLQQVVRGRFSGFLLQGQVHPLMAAVLLRTPGLDALDRDAQAQPPDGKLA